MVHSQTPETSTLPAAGTPIYAEPQLTEELLERFDSFAQKVARHDGVSAFSEQTRIELSKALHESTLTLRVSLSPRITAPSLPSLWRSPRQQRRHRRD